MQLAHALDGAVLPLLLPIDIIQSNVPELMKHFYILPSPHIGVRRRGSYSKHLLQKINNVN